MQDVWDKRYQETGHLYGAEPNVFIQEINQRYPISGHTLAIAEGEGRNILYIARSAQKKHLPIDVEMWDYSKVALSNAQSYAQAQGIELKTYCVDLAHASWPENEYDNILCVFGHFDSDTRLKTLQGIRQALKNGGYFIGEVYSKTQLNYQTGGPGKFDFLYDPQEILQVFHKDHLVHFFVGDVERYEGKLHHGKSHVIQFMIKVVKA